MNTNGFTLVSPDHTQFVRQGGAGLTRTAAGSKFWATEDGARGWRDRWRESSKYPGIENFKVVPVLFVIGGQS